MWGKAQSGFTSADDAFLGFFLYVGWENLWVSLIFLFELYTWMVLRVCETLVFSSISSLGHQLWVTWVSWSNILSGEGGQIVNCMYDLTPLPCRWTVWNCPREQVPTAGTVVCYRAQYVPTVLFPGRFQCPCDCVSLLARKYIYGQENCQLSVGPMSQSEEAFPHVNWS